MRISDWSSDVCASALRADAIGRQLLMAAIVHLLVFRTPQDVDHMCAAVAFAALRKPSDTGQQLLRFQRPDFGDFGFQAVVASTAPPFEHFTKEIGRAHV